MWIHQRTGQNTAVSFPLWAAVVGAMAIIGLIGEGSAPAIGFLVLFVLVRVGFALYERSQTRTATDRVPSLTLPGRPLPREARGEYRRLAAQERLDEGVARPTFVSRKAGSIEDLERLRAKYRNT